MFSIAEVLRATSGKLIRGEGPSFFKGISMDTRTIKRGEAFIAIKGDNFDGHDFIAQAVRKGASCVIKERRGRTPALKQPSVVEVADTIKALGDLARFNRDKYGIPVIAVTGSNGKTTTKEMIHWALSAKYKVLKNEGTKNNHIGLPLTLLNLDKSIELAVLEIGTNHFGEVEYLAAICKPNIAVITNIGASHLEYFRSLEGVSREKLSLLAELRNPSIALLNSDDPYLKRELSRKKSGRFELGFGMRHKADFLALKPRVCSGKTAFRVNSKYDFTLQTRGCYNIYNALAAVALGRIFGLGYADISSRLSAFKFPQGRLNFIKIKGLSFLDDTYNANPLSLREALKALSASSVRGRRILLLGDMRELGGEAAQLHKEAGRLAAGCCDVLVTVGHLTDFTAETAASSGMDPESIFTCGSSAQAKKLLFRKIVPTKNDLILIKGSRLMRMEEVLKF